MARKSAGARTPVEDEAQRVGEQVVPVVGEPDGVDVQTVEGKGGYFGGQEVGPEGGTTSTGTAGGT